MRNKSVQSSLNSAPNNTKSNIGHSNNYKSSERMPKIENSNIDKQIKSFWKQA